MEPANILFELIKFDMQRIQSYSETVLHISIIIVAASFAISAFLHSKDNSIDSRHKNIILATTNFGFILVLMILAVWYIEALNSSRAVQEIRETALKAYVNNKSTFIAATSIYPGSEQLKNYHIKMNLGLEKLPLFLTMGVIFVKTMVEIIFVSKNIKHS
jgi:hypothetical protein